MRKFGDAVVRFRVPILIVALLLVIPSAWGYLNTSVNYDLLTYLPDSIDTVKGQNILKEDFGKGAFSLIVTEGLDDGAVADLTEKIGDVESVDTALSYSEIAKSARIPEQAIPEQYLSKLKNGDASMIAVFFKDGTSAGTTLDAVEEIRALADENVYVSGMSAFVLDLRNIADHEEPFYVAVAVACSLILLLLCTDTFLAPFVFLISIGIAIIYNLGTNYFLGEVSYITKALAAVLQLAVTMDFSIFLWSSFEENVRKYDDHKEAMAQSIADTLVAILSSSMTATAGFLSMVFMTFTLGQNLGIVMAKGCILGVIGTVTLLPSLILALEKPMLKLVHKRLIPDVGGLAKIITSRPAVIVFVCLALALVFPAVYGFINKPMYYDFTSMVIGQGSTLTEEETQFNTANKKLEEDFDIATTEMILCSDDIPHAQAKEMLRRIQDVEGVAYVIGYDFVKGGLVPDELIPSKIKDAFVHEGQQLILINSMYAVSSNEVNAQIEAINAIMKEYDPDGMLIGEAPATKDLTEIMDHDFMVVDALAIIAVLIIIAIAFQSITLPFILVLVIELAIMINLGLPYYTNDIVCFISPICISTIQLGSTVNYAILMTTRYKRERAGGLEKREAAETAFRMTFPAVVTSGGSFFAATIGVSLVARMGLISQLCGLMARGALISTLCVLFILPAFFVSFDKLIVKTSRGFKPKRNDKFVIQEV
ncbi:MAG: MMPL family transporter [Eggerthellaceae bacterium]|nr:MMPL family transporter [Eggerthellaceae bacterium]